MQVGTLGLLLPTLGMVFGLGWRCRSSRSSWRLLILIVACSVMLMGCPDLFGGNDDDDAFTSDLLSFTVVLPEAGVMAQGSMSGPLAVPAVSIDGRMVTVLP